MWKDSKGRDARARWAYEWRKVRNGRDARRGTLGVLIASQRMPRTYRKGIAWLDSSQSSRWVLRMSELDGRTLAGQTLKYQYDGWDHAESLIPSMKRNAREHLKFLRVTRDAWRQCGVYKGAP
jgi:hypothetical protein